MLQTSKNLVKLKLLIVLWNKSCSEGHFVRNDGYEAEFGRLRCNGLGIPSRCKAQNKVFSTHMPRRLRSVDIAVGFMKFLLKVRRMISTSMGSLYSIASKAEGRIQFPSAFCAVESNCLSTSKSSLHFVLKCPTPNCPPEIRGHYVNVFLAIQILKKIQMSNIASKIGSKLQLHRSRTEEIEIVNSWQK